jgi:cation:H+ antiporter
MLSPWLQFIACASVIWIAGMRVSKYGDLIAEKTGASRTWIGVVLMASVTSLPELFTGISSTTIAQTPDIAIGDILGSCVFNLLILVIVDMLHGHRRVFTSASRGHVLTAGFGVLLIGAVTATLALQSLVGVPSIGHVSVASLVIVGLYATSMRGVFRYEMEQIAERAEELGENTTTLTLRQIVTRYVIWALVVVLAASWLPFIGAQLATQMGWGHSFVGSMFIAFATSLPEVVVTVGCVRQGATDLAIGNVLGSNLFNILILAIDDVFYVAGPLYAAVQPVHIVTAITSIMMTGVAVVGLLYHPRSRLFGIIGWVSASLIALYLFSAFVLYAHPH